MATPSDLVGRILPALHERNNGTCGRTVAPVRGKRDEAVGAGRGSGTFAGRQTQRESAPDIRREARSVSDGFIGAAGADPRQDRMTVGRTENRPAPSATRRGRQQLRRSRSGSVRTRTKTAGQVTVALGEHRSPCRHLGDRRRRRPIMQHLRCRRRTSHTVRPAHVTPALAGVAEHPRPTQPQGRRQHPLRSGSEGSPARMRNATPTTS